MENELKRQVLEMESAFYGITTMDLRRAAYRVTVVSRLAGKDWMHEFAHRHHLSIRTPQSTSMNRVLAFDREKVSRFFQLLKSVYNKDKIPPRRIYNLEESGITSVPKPGKILVLTGRKNVGRIASDEKGRTVTVVAAISASENFIPPVMIFPRKRMNERLLNDAVPGTLGYVSGNGWIDSSLFVTYLDHFISYSNATKENKVLLILDNHVSHKSIEAIEKAVDNGIVLLTLPPYTSSKLQPLDRSVFRSLKIYYSQECDKWMTNHHGRKISEYEMASILKPAFLNAMSPSNIISRFQSTGIYPCNPDVITADDYEAADAARGLDRSTSEPAGSTSRPSDVLPVSLESVGSTSRPSDVVASTSGSRSFRSIDVICPVVKRSTSLRTSQRKRAAEQAEIVIDSPYKGKLIEKKLSKESNAATNNKNKKSDDLKKMAKKKGKEKTRAKEKQ